MAHFQQGWVGSIARVAGLGGRMRIKLLVVQMSLALGLLGRDARAHSPAVWTAETDTAGYLGGDVATGDINGDGLADVVVAARSYSNGGTTGGRVFVWFGERAGLGSPGTPANADWYAYESEYQPMDSQWGDSVSLGDVNGDGYDDLLIGAPYRTNVWPSQYGEGLVYLYLGSASGLGPPGVPSNADWFAEGNQAHNSYPTFGDCSAMGDFNGDGYDDVVVGHHRYDNGTTDEGMVFVWLGSATGLGPSGSPTNADWSAESNQNLSNFGRDVVAADVNGDGYDDLVVGAGRYNGVGRVFLWLGSSTGLGPAGSPANADWFASGSASEAFGYKLASGDLNGDGYEDLVVGNWMRSQGQTNEGMVAVWFGSVSGLGPTGAYSNADWTAESDQATAVFGDALAVGDTNADGFDDLIVSAYYFDSPEVDEGLLLVWMGGEGGLGANGTVANGDWTVESNRAGANLGESVAVGDFDGNGKADILAGAPSLATGPGNSGRAYVYYAPLCGLQYDSSYGRLLFTPTCTKDASALGGDIYRRAEADIYRAAKDVFYLSSSGDHFVGLVVDDELRINGVDSTLGPYGSQPGTPPYTLNIPIEANFVPEPPPAINSFVPQGATRVVFELADTNRALYGNTPVYLMLDCGLHLSGKTPSRVEFISRDDEGSGVPSQYDLVSGSLLNLRARGTFGAAVCRGPATGGWTDTRPAPSPGDAYYYLARGRTSCLPQGFGDSTATPDPRDALDAGSACP